MIVHLVTVKFYFNKSNNRGNMKKVIVRVYKSSAYSDSGYSEHTEMVALECPKDRTPESIIDGVRIFDEDGLSGYEFVLKVNKWEEI